MIDASVESHFMGEGVDVRWGVVCLTRRMLMSGGLVGGVLVRRTRSDADEDHQSFGYTGDHFAIDCET